MPDKDITLRQEELRIAKESLATNKELLKIQQRKGALSENDVKYARNIANVLQDQVKYDKYSVNERRKITSLSKKLLDLSEKVYTFDVKGLGTTTKSEKIQKQILQTQQNLRILGLQRNKIGEKGSKLQKEINDNINLQIASTRKVTVELERQRKAAKEIEENKIANNFGALGDLLAKIPLVSSLAPAFKEGSEAARKMGASITLFGDGLMGASDYTGKNLAKFGKNARVEFTHTGDSVKKLQIDAKKAQDKLDAGAKDPKGKLKKAVKKGKTKVGAKEKLFGAAAKSSLTKGTAKLKGVNKQMLLLKAAWEKMGPILAKLAAIFLFDALMKADQMLTDIRRNLGVSQEEGYKLNLQFNKMANNADSLRVNLESIRKASSALNNAYGTAVMFSEQELATSAEILDAKLMDGEATANLAMMARINNQTLGSSLKSQEDAVNSVNAEHKTRISLKAVLNEANKITGQISAQLGGDSKRIAAAVTQAKALGMEFKEIAASSKKLLDFESSIEAELTAELMLGKSLNLEKARLAALTGDYSTFMDEINSQVGDFGDFMNLNVLQQDALAASVGMTTDALSKQLMKKANLNELAEEARAAGKHQLAQSYMELSATEEFGLAVQKVKDAFVSLMAVVQPIANTIGYMIEGFRMFAPAIKVATGAMAGYLLVTQGAAIVTAIKSVFTGPGAIPYVGYFIAAALAAGIAGKIKSMTKKAGDVMSPANGKTEVSTKEGGLFELSKKDDLAAGPGILDKLAGAAINPLGALVGLFGGEGKKSDGGGTNLAPVVEGLHILTSSVNTLSSIVSSKFDILTNITTNGFALLLNPQTEKDTSSLQELAVKRNFILTKLALITAMSSNPYMGFGHIAMSEAMNLMKSQPQGIETVQDPTINETKMSSSKSSIQEEGIQTKLDEIKKVLQGKQNINVSVSNKLKYDSFSDNNTSYVDGKESTERNNNSSFI